MNRLLSSVALLLAAVGLAAQWQEIETKLDTSVWASSTLCEQVAGKTVCYEPGNLFDTDPGTCWVEGAEGDGIGESVTFVVNEPVESLTLVNGFARSPSLFEKNNRVKRVSISFLAAYTAPGLVTELDYYLYFAREHVGPEIELEDTPEPQSFEILISSEQQEQFLWQTFIAFAGEHPDFAVHIKEDLCLSEDATVRELENYRDEIFAAFGMSCLKLEIREVYRGSRYRDTCISEIELP